MAESDQITVTASDFQQEASASELAEVEDRARPYLNQEPPDALEQKALDLHNAARTKRGTKELVWDAGLTYEAYQWALELVRVDHMKHRGNNKIENIASMTAAPPNPYEKATQLWLAEETNYRAAPSDKAGYQAWRSDWNKWKDAGHYAVCMSKKTERVGMNWLITSQGKVYVVAAYDPPGDFYFEKEYP